MGLAASARVLTAGAVWRLTGASRAGTVLIEAAGSTDENNQMLAGMLLVRAGDRSVDPVTNALTGGTGSPQLVDVLTSIGSARARRGLQSLTDQGGAIGDAARQALCDLDQMDG
ncbi:MAG: hypothetical protein P1T08_07860 [Acidimicrobiia bacterium]|nr:hypothetical protein [Acidimicrobiia bacterium]